MISKMINKVTYVLGFFFLIGLVSTTITPHLVSAAEYSYESDNSLSENLIKEYFYALVNGDTDYIQTFLSKNLLEERVSQLNNPRYSTFLIKIYENAHMKILCIRRTSPDTTEVDVSIVLSDQESRATQFLLKDGRISGDPDARLQIYAEIDISDVQSRRSFLDGC